MKINGQHTRNGKVVTVSGRKTYFIFLLSLNARNHEAAQSLSGHLTLKLKLILGDVPH